MLVQSYNEVRLQHMAYIVKSWLTALPVKPSSKITVGRTVETPQPPIAWKIQMSVKLIVVGSLKSDLTCLEFHVFDVDVG